MLAIGDKLKSQVFLININYYKVDNSWKREKRRLKKWIKNVHLPVIGEIFPKQI